MAKHNKSCEPTARRDRQIDALVYASYELTEEEIRIVEENSNSSVTRR